MMADVYKPHVSGITNYIAQNKRQLEANGHEVFVFTFGDQDYNDEETNIIRSPGLPILDTGYYISLNYTRAARKLVHSMDVIHVNHPFVSGTLALRYCRPRGIPVIFTNHTRYDLYAQAYIPGLGDMIGGAAIQAYLPAFCRKCDLVIAPSAGMKEVLTKFGVDSRVEVVPNGVDLSPYRERVTKKDRAQYGFRDDDVIFIYTGRLGPEKNLHFLLHSFSGMALAYPNVRLLLVGGGPEEYSLQEQVREQHLEGRVVFTGMVPYHDIPEFLRMADVFVTASVTEVHPLSVIEAMASGLPVLGIQSPGVGDTISDNETGYLVPRQDLPAFTAKMIRLATETLEREQMGIQARLASEKYAIDLTSRGLLDCYREVTQSASGRKRNFRVRFTRIWDRWTY